MTRRRQVGGTTTFKTDGDHKRFSFIDISQSSEDTVIHNGTKHGLSFNASEEYQKQDKDFGIAFSLDRRKNTVVPLGIFNFNNKAENACFCFNYTLSGDTLNSLEFQVRDSDGNIIYQMTHLEAVVVTAAKKPMLLADIENKAHEEAQKGFKMFDWQNILKKYEPKSEDLTQPGSYTIFWDGFDNEGIYDSTRFNNKNLKAKITATKNGISKSLEVPFNTLYDEVDWVDVKIDKNSKKIETTIRVNLKDGGENGLGCIERDIDPDPKFRVPVTECPWDKIPAGDIKPGNPPIKSRTRSFTDLVKLAIDGLNYHWGRNHNHAAAKNIQINSEQYEVFVNSINTEDSAMDDIDLLYNTNSFWGRSNNPGCVSGFKSLLANIAQYIPYVPLNETIFYNVGYVNNVYKAEAHFLFRESWHYIDDRPLYKNGISKVDMEYAYTCAHEIGHTILRAYAEGGGGSADYSYQHKGSSGYSETKPVSEGGVSYPLNGEIDVMKYFNNTPYFLNYDFERIAAEDKDVLGLIWLTKIKIK